jgi:hypothetical protein
MLTTAGRILALIQIVMAAAAAAVPGAPSTIQHIQAAIDKANAAIAALTSLVPIHNAQTAVDDLAAAVTILHAQGLVPASAQLASFESLILSTDASLHNYLSGQAVPVAPISVEGKPGFVYAIPNDATGEINTALGR